MARVKKQPDLSKNEPYLPQIKDPVKPDLPDDLIEKIYLKVKGRYAGRTKAEIKSKLECCLCYPKLPRTTYEECILEIYYSVKKEVENEHANGYDHSLHDTPTQEDSIKN
jgi:hypothetical protein